MASLIYNSCVDDLVNGNINFSTDTFKVMLVTSAYAPSKTTDLKRSAVSGEVVGAGYTAGGVATACTVAKNPSTNAETMTFAGVTWATSTITARAAVIYKSRGGAPAADELVAYVDFGADVASTSDTFTVTFSSPLTIQN